jgi:hypothetical protein
MSGGPVALSADSLVANGAATNAADDQKLREVAASVDTLCAVVEAKTPRGASERLKNWYAEQVGQMVARGEQAQAFRLLKTVQGNLSKIADRLMNGDDSSLRILEKFAIVVADGRRVGFDLRRYLEQPDDSPEALGNAIDSVMALSAGAAPSAEEEIRRRCGISPEAWRRYA